jgi:DNA-binding CsgD family transcriptional regulator
MKPHHAAEALRALCKSGLHPDVLVPAFLEALHAVVPSYRNLFDWTDAQGRLVRYYIEGPIDTAVAQLYFDAFHNKLEAAAMPTFDSLKQQASGVRSAQELQHMAFYGSALYTEIRRPQSFHTRLEAVIRGASGQLIGSLVLYRGLKDPSYSRDDELRLASTLPAFAAAMESYEPVNSDDTFIPTPHPPETLLLTLDGSLCHASPGAHALLLMAEGRASRDALSRPLDALAGSLLQMLMALLREQALPAQLTPPRSPSSQLMRTTPAGRFVATGTLLTATQSTEQSLVQVSLQRFEPHRVALARALRALPLSPTQMAVCCDLYHGYTHTEIGQRMGLAISTVTSHMRNAYDKLDVRSAIALRSALEAKIYPTFQHEKSL